ncbi:Peptidyl-prolyl isomerase cwc27 [Coemansia sp. RSA 552]|nr:Peptidyl-prolyl isomerase cwc27 [Coemansia sp. RSA 552]
MSSVYVSEPPTSGKLVLETSAGNLDVELWSKEAPKACRNFTQLCMEGYYDGTIFHRVCPGWIVQGGDPSGTGEGGESIYGKPFADEFHSRLRFSRRGMLGMASTGPNTNGSQFFITLAPTPELQKKHTLFATLGEGEVDDETERPVFPKKLLRTRVLDNPFADIEPRKKPAPDALPAIPAASKGKKRKAKAVKNKRLLSKPAGAGTKRQREGAGEDALLARLGAFQARIRGSKQARQGQQGQGAGGSWLAHSLNFDDDANR